MQRVLPRLRLAYRARRYGQFFGELENPEDPLISSPNYSDEAERLPTFASDEEHQGSGFEGSALVPARVEPDATIVVLEKEL